MAEQILVTTTENIPGRKYEIIGEVFGVTTQSKNAIRDFGAGLKSIVGGEIKAYTSMLTESRDQSVARLRQNAVHSCQGPPLRLSGSGRNRNR